MSYLLVFLAAGLAIVVAGTMLTRYADQIASATGVGRLWIGSLLLAGATSLPELGTDVAAVRLGAVDLAVGDLFGSSMANMLILALVDMCVRRKQMLQQVALDHALAATLAMSLNAMAAILILLRWESSVLGISPGSLLLLSVYLAGTRVVYRQTSRIGVPRAPDGGPLPGLRPAVMGFLAAAVTVMITAPAFAWAARGIAELTGLGNTMMGTWLVGLATSLPELVSALAAVRMGAFDLAVGSLFGSNAFNMVVFVALDLAQPGSLFAGVDPSHAISGLFAVVLMSLGLAAIVYRAKRRLAVIEPDSLLIIVTYVVALWVLYQHGRGP